MKVFGDQNGMRMSIHFLEGGPGLKSNVLESFSLHFESGDRIDGVGRII